MSDVNVNLQDILLIRRALESYIDSLEMYNDAPNELERAQELYDRIGEMQIS